MVCSVFVRKAGSPDCNLRNADLRDAKNITYCFVYWLWEFRRLRLWYSPRDIPATDKKIAL